ncbi:MAG: MerR family transcriptional regulator [Chloroflexi bacterium]|nr:MerR family transcriptional regulator [Chloroflexota bacterium]
MEKVSIYYLRTSDLAKAVGIHPNTVRLYVDWGLLPPVEKSPSGYRLFTQRHLECLRLARMIYAEPYPGKHLRSTGKAILMAVVKDDWGGALEKAFQHWSAVKSELTHAETALMLLDHWVEGLPTEPFQVPLSIAEVSALLHVSRDVIRNWERNGLITIPRNSYNRYRIFGTTEIGRMRVIRMLSQAGYSHMAILRMFIELEGGAKDDLRHVLDTPRPDEDVFMASDRWLSTLHEHELRAEQIIWFIKDHLETM